MTTQATEQHAEQFGIDLETLDAALERIRPALQADGGDLTFNGIDDEGVVHLELLGACGTCPMSLFTLVAGIERIVIERVPGVQGVMADGPAILGLSEMSADRSVS